jgi:hypothetical protein
MEVGDRVVCVKSHKDPECPLKKGATYTILSIDICACGDISIDVGIKCPVGVECYCGRMVAPFDIWWLNPKLFAPITYNSAHDELLNKEIVEEKADIKIKEPQI